MNPMTIENLLNKALSSECGVSVTLPTAYLAHHYRRKLYAERERLRLSNITAYDGLSFLVRNKTELWVVRRDAFNPPAEIVAHDCRPLSPSELPPRILSRGKSRAFIGIS